jgi:hypothetical protein
VSTKSGKQRLGDMTNDLQCHGIHQGDMSLRQVTPNMGNGSVNQSGEHGGTVAFMLA